jgi:hypothetical protein
VCRRPFLRQFARSEDGGTGTAKQSFVIKPNFDTASSEHSSTADFWQRILADGSLQNCANLEKLLAGCEIIAALDDLDLLAA